MDRLRGRGPEIRGAERLTAVRARVPGLQYDDLLRHPVAVLDEAEPGHAHEPVGAGRKHRHERDQGEVAADLELEADAVRRAAAAVPPHQALGLAGAGGRLPLRVWPR